MKLLLQVIKSYGWMRLPRIAIDLLRTKLFYKHSRLIRFPFYVRGLKSIDLGARLTTGTGVRIESFSSSESKKSIIFGDDIQLNDYVHIAAIDRVEIGNFTLIASRVFISDHNHGRFDTDLPEYGPDTPPTRRPLNSLPVFIGNNVWIGESVCILPGVTIGDGSVIGAGAVVTRNIPARCVAAGNPARVIRRWDADTREWKRV